MAYCARSLVVVALVLGWVGIAAADDAPAAAAQTLVTGRVTDVVGRPIPNARIYVMPRAGQRILTKTDKDGRYRAAVTTAGTYGVVIAIDKGHAFRTLLVEPGVTNTLDVEVELDTAGGEVINIQDRRRPEPAVKAKSTQDERTSLPYSDEAVERDAWARAWLLLDVDETGAVTRLKLLKRPGFDLDRICIEEAFTLRFDPARDGAGKPMKTYLLWTMEWPAWGWLVQGNGTALRKPASDELQGRNRGPQDVAQVRKQTDYSHEQLLRGALRVTAEVGTAPWASPPAVGTAFSRPLSSVPCAGSAPLDLDLRNRAYRDCSPPDLRAAASLPWITRATAATAVAELAAPELTLVTDEPPRHSPVPGYALAGVTGALAVTTIYSLVQFSKYQDRARDQQWQATTDPDAHHEIVSTRDRWGKISLGFGLATVISGGVTLIVWNRDASRRSFSVQPSSGGGSASFSMAF